MNSAPYPGEDCVDRLAGYGEHTIAAEMNEEEISGLHGQGSQCQGRA